MTLEVDSAALRSFGTALQEWSTDTAKARAYVAQHLDLEYADSRMFVNVLTTNLRAVGTLNRVLDRLRTLLRESGLELAAAAKVYDETDDDAAQRMDAGHEPLRSAPAGRRYSDVETRRHEDGSFADTAPAPPPPEPPPAIDVGALF